MKNIILIMILFVAAGCSKPAKTEDSVVGKYLLGELNLILRKDKIYEKSFYNQSDDPLGKIGRWEVINGEVVTTTDYVAGTILGESKQDFENAHGKYMMFLRIEANGNLTSVAKGWNKDGEVQRIDKVTAHFRTWKKLK